MGGSRNAQGRDEKRIKILVGKLVMKLRHTKLRGLSPHANCTDRAAAAGRRS